MEVTLDVIKELRQKTGAGVMDCKKALQEAGGDLEKAVDLLRKKGLQMAQKRSSKAAEEGRITAYVHGDGKIGVIVEVNCETDFVARTDLFKNFAFDMAMQVAAANPLFVSRDDVPQELVEREKKIYTEQAVQQGKPEKVIDRIVEGKIQKYFQEVCLLEQKFIKDDKKTVRDVLNDLIASLGENIVIRRFCRFQLGEESR